MSSVEYSEAIVEVLDILNHSNSNIVEKIPKKLIEFWEQNKSITYKPKLDHTKEIKDMNLKKKTKSIITMIYFEYLCDDFEKENIKLILQANEEKYQKELREKYNPDNIFRNDKKTEEYIEEKNVQDIDKMTNPVVINNNIFVKICNRIKNFFFKKIRK